MQTIDMYRCVQGFHGEWIIMHFIRYVDDVFPDNPIDVLK